MPTDLERGREACREQAWLAAFESLVSADQATPLGPSDLRLLATAAYMLGRDEEYVASLERAHQRHLDAGDIPSAVRCGFWIGHSFVFRGHKARGSGWFARAARLLEGLDRDCVERGYLRIPVWLEEMGRGDFELGYRTAVEAAGIGERFGDADLVWLARDDQARALLRLGRIDEALRLVDEALVAAASGALSPIVTGIVYCNTIAFCWARHEWRHVREWTMALSDWCARQPEMIAHNGLCLVHRAQLKLIEGDWDAALEEARRSADRFTRGALNALACGEAHYCQGEAHRLRGKFDEAEDAYQRASQHGREPQPGLSLMRLSQGKVDAAAAAIRRVIGETTAPAARAGRLPAYIEIMIAAGSLELARAGCRELDELSTQLRSEALGAMAAGSRGAVAVAEKRAGDALVELRRSLVVLQELGARYEIARVRVQVGLACRALGDEDTARLELVAARRDFEALGALTDLGRIATLMPDVDERLGEAHGLTARELEVLRRVAAGKTNREIATELFISEFTVARHVQNILAKLSVSSRTAATAFAFAHNLL